ncbi:hypothetical protein B0H12DRAFT_1105265 [Mycena haematopus]|nr:hypothetical protein B0H12DRAFT_1105265 [Mycena haematopus]
MTIPVGDMNNGKGKNKDTDDLVLARTTTRSSWLFLGRRGWWDGRRAQGPWGHRGRDWRSRARGWGIACAWGGARALWATRGACVSSLSCRTRDGVALAR